MISHLAQLVLIWAFSPAAASPGATCATEVSEDTFAMSMFQRQFDLQQGWIAANSSSASRSTKPMSSKPNSGYGSKQPLAGWATRTHMPAHVTHDSSEIGNLIDVWYFGGLQGFVAPAKEREQVWLEELAEKQCPETDHMCFGKYLVRRNRSVTPLSELELGEVNSLLLDPNQENVTLMERASHPIYFTPMVRAVSEGLSADLASLTHEYAEHFSPNLLTSPGSRHCTVHYRVGDLADFLVSIGEPPLVISLESVAAQVSRFSPQPTTVEILSGGANHNASEGDSGSGVVIEKSRAFLAELQAAIKAQLPGAHVFMSDGSPDEDWFKLATSPMVVVTSGSFGLTGALAGVSNQVRSPGALHSLLPARGQEPSGIIRPGWTTYSYNLSRW